MNRLLIPTLPISACINISEVDNTLALIGNFHKFSFFLWRLVDNPLSLSLTPCNGIRFNPIDPARIPLMPLAILPPTSAIFSGSVS
jgi:hypothetical protein